MKPNRWPYLDNPLGFKLPEPKPVIHPIIEKWDDLPEDQKEVLKRVKTVILAVLGPCQISLFGSRVKGYWTEESDYDIRVHKMPLDVLKDVIRKSDYGAKIQISFQNTEYIEAPGTILI